MKKIILISLLSFSVHSYSAGFDCNLASSKVEHSICENSVVSKLDEELNAAYKVAVHIDANLKQDQRNWVRDVRNSSSDLEPVYRDRLEYINGIVKSGRKVNPINRNDVTNELKDLGRGIGLYKPCVDQYQMSEDNFDYLKRNMIDDAKQKYGPGYDSKLVKIGYDEGLDMMVILSNTDFTNFIQVCSFVNDTITTEIEKNNTSGADFE